MDRFLFTYILQWVLEVCLHQIRELRKIQRSYFSSCLNQFYVINNNLFVYIYLLNWTFCHTKNNLSRDLKKEKQLVLTMSMITLYLWCLSILVRWEYNTNDFSLCWIIHKPLPILIHNVFAVWEFFYFK